MSVREKGIFSGLLVIFFVVLLFVAVACGENDKHPHVVTIEEIDTIERAGNEDTFTDQEIIQSCFSAACHGDSKNPIPNLGDGFKQSQAVRARVTSGSMPPSGWSAENVKKFLRYLNSSAD